MTTFTLGRAIRAGRREKDLSQRELWRAIARKYSAAISYPKFSQIENDRIDISGSDYDWLLRALSEIFEVDLGWLEQLRRQTVPQRQDLSRGIFPIYATTHHENEINSD